LDDDNIASVVINLALGIYPTAFKLALQNQERRKIVEDLFLKIMDNECHEMCKKSSHSVLKDTGVDGLTKDNLQSVCHSKRSRKATCNSNVISTVGAIILYSRCPQMSALAYRLGFVMRHAGAGTWYVFKHVSRVLKLLTLSLRNCLNILLLPDHLALK
jgi:hypothetical protein